MINKKLLRSLVVALIAVMAVALPAFAAYYPKIVLTINSKIATIDGVATTMDKAPYISSEGSTMVPLAFVAKTFGYDVVWDNTQKKITVSNYFRKMEMVVGQKVVLIDDEPFQINSPAVISQEGYVMVPVRFVSEVMGYSVYYIPEDKTITIQNIDKIPKTEEPETVVNVTNIGDDPMVLIPKIETISIWSEPYDQITIGNSLALHAVVAKQKITYTGHNIIVQTPTIYGGPNVSYNTTVNRFLENEAILAVNNYMKEVEAKGAKSGYLYVEQFVDVVGDVVSVYTARTYKTNEMTREVSEITTHNYDMGTRKEIALKDVFVSGTDYEKILLDKVKESLVGVTPYYTDGQIDVNSLTINNFQLTKLGFAVINTNGTGRFGSIEILLTYKELEKYMVPYYYNMLTK